MVQSIFVGPGAQGLVEESKSDLRSWGGVPQAQWHYDNEIELRFLFGSGALLRDCR